jgi:hypothetical protein
LLHLLLHLSVTIALSYTLEIWLDNALETLFLTAVAFPKWILNDVALELQGETVSQTRREGPLRSFQG